MQISPPILILGMHRSGTSCLAGCLEEAGLYLGDVNLKAGFNKKGNRENRKIMEHHDAILARIEAAWDNPPSEDPIWNNDEKTHLIKLLSAYDNETIWGVKDPRVLFLLEGWYSITKPKFVGTFRHPQEVVASLVHRSKVWNQPMDIEKAFALWAAYNAKLLSVHNEQAFDIIRYDIETKIYNQKIIKMASKLGLRPATSNSFREEELHNQNTTDLSIPAEYKWIWEALNDLTI